MTQKRKLKVAILDMYEQQPNQGMRCLRDILDQFAAKHALELTRDEFEVRVEKQTPDLSYDVYISSGGPGSPLDSEGSAWEQAYFSWLKRVEDWNAGNASAKKSVLFICHSFQLACRHYNAGSVCKRRSTSFGIFPMHLLEAGKAEHVFRDLDDPFYAVDSRDFQVVSPNKKAIEQAGGAILAIEKERPHIPLERAVMAIRFNDHMLGTQFHPEADPVGMSMYLQREDKKTTVIREHGEAKWRSMIAHLNDPDKIRWTYAHLIPNFLASAAAHQPDA